MRYRFIPHTGMSSQPVAVPLPSLERRLAPICHIQATVALSYDISPDLMKSRTRWRKAAWPRQVAMYLARELTEHSLPTIGRYFGNRDHSTVVHACHAVRDRMAHDEIYRADVEALRSALAA